METLEPPDGNGVQYMLDRMDGDKPIELGPLRPDLDREAQHITDAPIESAENSVTVQLERTGFEKIVNMSG